MGVQHLEQNNKLQFKSWTINFRQIHTAYSSTINFTFLLHDSFFDIISQNTHKLSNDDSYRLPKHCCICNSVNIVAWTRSRWNNRTLWRFRNPLESVDHRQLQRAAGSRIAIPETFLIKSNSNLIARWLLFASFNRGPLINRAFRRVLYRSCTILKTGCLLPQQMREQRSLTFLLSAKINQPDITTLSSSHRQ